MCVSTTLYISTTSYNIIHQPNVAHQHKASCISTGYAGVLIIELMYVSLLIRKKEFCLHLSKYV